MSSLRLRLLFSASVVLAIFLSLSGLILDQAFRRSLQQGLAERLRVQIYGLLAVAEVDGVALVLPESLQEPRFNTMGSGLRAFVLELKSANGGQWFPRWRSPSALDVMPIDLSPQVAALQRGEEWFGRIGSGEAAAFLLAYHVRWNLPAGGREFLFLVTEDTGGYVAELRAFRGSLWVWLGGAAVALLLVQALVMGWGLAPLGRLAEEIRAIEDGRRDALSGKYPDELEGVTRNLNLLISGERARRRRYRDTLADLAHSLKTPLAILRNEAAADTPAKPAIEEQVRRMDEIVGHQLRRAVPGAVPLGGRVAVAPLADRLLEALAKVYAEQAVRFDVSMGDVYFVGDAGDLMELLGNLLDNACKYGAGRVRLEIRAVAGEAASGRAERLRIEVADDGPGFPQSLRNEVLRRGRRADSQAAGQGIGLAVVADIVDQYAGTLELGVADLGGGRVTVLL